MKYLFATIFLVMVVLVSCNDRETVTYKTSHGGKTYTFTTTATRKNCAELTPRPELRFLAGRQMAGRCDELGYPIGTEYDPADDMPPCINGRIPKGYTGCVSGGV